MLIDVPCVGVTDPINEIVMDQITNCVGLIYVVNCTQGSDFEVNKVSENFQVLNPAAVFRPRKFWSAVCREEHPICTV